MVSSDKAYGKFRKKLQPQILPLLLVLWSHLKQHEDHVHVYGMIISYFKLIFV